MACVLAGRYTAVTWLSPRVESAAVPVAPSELVANPVPLEPCPCDGCRFAVRCKDERLACVAFSMFMAGKSTVLWKMAPRVPTRERYEALLGETASPWDTWPALLNKASEHQRIVLPRCFR
jgi:hypothetical protein